MTSGEQVLSKAKGKKAASTFAPRHRLPGWCSPPRGPPGFRAAGQTEPQRKQVGPGSWVSGAAAAARGQAGGREASGSPLGDQGPGNGEVAQAGWVTWPRASLHPGPALEFQVWGCWMGRQDGARRLEDPGDPGSQSSPELSGRTGWVWAKRGRFEGLLQDWPVECPHPFPCSGLERKVYQLVPAQPACLPPSQASYPDRIRISSSAKKRPGALGKR